MDRHKGNKIKPAGDLQQRIRKWCAFQERSHFEARRKLLSFGMTNAEAERTVAALISENYINEERFAIAYAGGHFRLKQWGRARIKSGLREHRVSEPCITAALKQIEKHDYERAVHKLAARKLQSIPGIDRRRKYQTTYRYLVGRGFEPELVSSTLGLVIGEVDDHEFRT